MSWVDSGATHLLQIEQLDLDLTYTLEIRARLGALKHSWAQAITVDSQGDVSAAIVPPADAFLDALAEDYVTDLAIVLVGRDDQGKVAMRWGAPGAFLAWPGGERDPAVVWDKAAMAQEAPMGVVDDTIRDNLVSLGADPAGRVLAPIPFTTTPPLDLAVEGE